MKKKRNFSTLANGKATKKSSSLEECKQNKSNQYHHLRPRAGSPAARLGREVPIIVEVIVIAPLDVLVTVVAATANAGNATAAAGPTLVLAAGTLGGGHIGARTADAGLGLGTIAIPVAVFDHMHIGLVSAGSGPVVVKMP